MRLRKIAENQNRRSFLKNMGAAASAISTGNLSGLSKAAMWNGGNGGNGGMQALGSLYFNLPDQVQKLVDNFTFNFINADTWSNTADKLRSHREFLEKYAKDGVVHYKYAETSLSDKLEYTSETTDEFGKPLPSFPVKAVLGRALSDDSHHHTSTMRQSDQKTNSVDNSKSYNRRLKCLKNLKEWNIL